MTEIIFLGFERSPENGTELGRQNCDMAQTVAQCAHAPASPCFSRGCDILPRALKPTSSPGGTRTCATILGKTGHHARARRRIRRTLCRNRRSRCHSKRAHYPLAAVGGQCTGSTPSAGHTVTHQRPLEGPLRAIDLEVLYTPIGVCRRQEFAHTPQGCNKYPWLSAK